MTELALPRVRRRRWRPPSPKELWAMILCVISAIGLMVIVISWSQKHDAITRGSFVLAGTNFMLTFALLWPIVLNYLRTRHD